MRVRGLKPITIAISIRDIVVAPHAGAWIETAYKHQVGLNKWSHPMRVRGLKQNNSFATANNIMSHPMRVRGLKLHTFLLLIII